jgi:hypothetical protein
MRNDNMGTKLRISVSGNEISALRSTVAAFLATKGMKRRDNVEFFDDRALSPSETAAIISGVYDQETKYPTTRITTLVIRSRLINVEIKRDEYRSI